ncbi:MAG: HAD family phosphatase [Roseococcus sp.]|nr:HAD family phosphatase [Roseococcus sp.]
MRRPAAVLFDCDGVLADSEHLINAILAEDLAARGWRISPEQARETFLGMAVPDMLPVLEARVGPLGPGWVAEMAERISRRMEAELRPIPGALSALAAVQAAGIPMACASNAGRVELLSKIRALGLWHHFEGRLFSWQDVPRPKPHPDIYLAAAAACGARPEDCVVVEDSLLGARAGIAAGCRVLGLARETAPSVLAAVGAEPFDTMAALPALLGIAADGD